MNKNQVDRGENMDYKYFIVEITTSNRLVFRENATTAVNIKTRIGRGNTDGHDE